jgi:hypothetical protein
MTYSEAAGLADFRVALGLEKQPPIRSAIHIDFPVDLPVLDAVHCPIPTNLMPELFSINGPVDEAIGALGELVCR